MIYVPLITRPFSTFQAGAVLAYLGLLVLWKLGEYSVALLHRRGSFIGIEESGGIESRRFMSVGGN